MIAFQLKPWGDIVSYSIDGDGISPDLFLVNSVGEIRLKSSLVGLNAVSYVVSLWLEYGQF